MHPSPPLQIIITFYIQGVLNLIFLCLKHSHSELEEWFDNLLDDFLIGSAAAGYAVCIAAFTQLNSITTYHLFLCYTFLSALSTVRRPFFGLISCPRKPFDRILGYYFLGNQLLLVAMNLVTIYRLNSAWDNASGKCFIVLLGGNGGPKERDAAVLWLYIDLIWVLLCQLVPASVVCSGRSELWATQSPKAKKIINRLFAGIAGIFYLVNLHWTIKLTISNQVLIDDNEYIFGFGQVGVLVTLCLSVWRAFISYEGAQRIF